MAKPIKATPALKGKDAEDFIKNMVKTGNRRPTKKEMEIFKDIMYMPDGRTPRCYRCGKAMFNVKDRTTGKISQYSWKCDCPKFPKNMVLHVG